MTKTRAQMLPVLRATVAAAVISRSGCVLLIRRRLPEKEGAAHLKWQFPAGAIEAGEEPEDAAVREAEEETGVRSAALLRLGERVHPTTHRSIVYVACHYLSGTARSAAPAEVAEAVWVPIPDLGRYIPHSGVFGPAWAYLSASVWPDDHTLL